MHVVGLASLVDRTGRDGGAEAAPRDLPFLPGGWSSWHGGWRRACGESGVWVPLSGLALCTRSAAEAGTEHAPTHPCQPLSFLRHS